MNVPENFNTHLRRLRRAHDEYEDFLAELTITEYPGGQKIVSAAAKVQRDLDSLREALEILEGEITGPVIVQSFCGRYPKGKYNR